MLRSKRTSSITFAKENSLQSVFPTIAGHLVSASFLSAPAALVMSKILLPETETPKTLGEHVEPHLEKERSLFEAIINGANTGMRLIAGIVALLIAVLGLVALTDQVLLFLGTKLNAIAVAGVFFVRGSLLLG